MLRKIGTITNITHNHQLIRYINQPGARVVLFLYTDRAGHNERAFNKFIHLSKTIQEPNLFYLYHKGVEGSPIMRYLNQNSLPALYYYKDGQNVYRNMFLYEDCWFPEDHIKKYLLETDK